MLGVLLSLMSSILAVPSSLVLYLVLHLHKAAFIAGIAITALPFIVSHVTFWFGVITSMWRTRVGTTVVSERDTI
jgi:hypothetical protein